MKPLARYASLNNYVELCNSLRLDPARLMSAAGLDVGSLSMPDRWVPAAAIADLLEGTAVVSGRDDIGLRLAQMRRLSSLGPLSMVIREEPNVRSALKMLIRHEHLFNEAIRTRLLERNGVATVRIGFDLGRPTESRQSNELAVGVMYRLLRDLLGADWHPLAVSFTHAASAAPYHDFFACKVEFEQDFNGVVMYTADLDTPNALSDPLLRPYAQQFLDAIGPSREATTADRVRELIELLLPTGRCSVDQIARSLGVNRRTLHRNLAETGETFSSVLNAVRTELAGHMVASRRHTLTEIAELLAFSSPSNFTRWFRNQFGCSPTQWRNQHTDSARGPAVSGK